MEDRDFKGVWIPKEIWLNKDLTPLEKMYLVEIDSLDKEDGCFASNKHFELMFGQQGANATRIITNLKNKGWIDISYTYNGKEIEKRVIKIKIPPYPDRYYKNDNTYYKNDKGVLSKLQEGYYKNDKDRIPILDKQLDIKENIQRKRFEKPTIQEIESYCNERNNSINAEAFYDFYESKDWYVGKNKMKDWKACVRTWEKRDSKNVNIPKWFDKEIEVKEDFEITDEERRIFGISN